jgi:hypothetical protein
VRQLITQIGEKFTEIAETKTLLEQDKLKQQSLTFPET